MIAAAATPGPPSSSERPSCILAGRALVVSGVLQRDDERRPRLLRPRRRRLRAGPSSPCPPGHRRRSARGGRRAHGGHEPPPRSGRSRAPDRPHHRRLRPRRDRGRRRQRSARPVLRRARAARGADRASPRAHGRHRPGLRRHDPRTAAATPRGLLPRLRGALGPCPHRSCDRQRPRARLGQASRRPSCGPAHDRVHRHARDRRRRRLAAVRADGRVRPRRLATLAVRVGDPGGRAGRGLARRVAAHRPRLPAALPGGGTSAAACCARPRRSRSRSPSACSP